MCCGVVLAGLMVGLPIVPTVAKAYAEVLQGISESIRTPQDPVCRGPFVQLTHAAKA
jgi:hypothetical protein